MFYGLNLPAHYRRRTSYAIIRISNDCVPSHIFLSATTGPSFDRASAPIEIPTFEQSWRYTSYPLSILISSLVGTESASRLTYPVSLSL